MYSWNQIKADFLMGCDGDVREKVFNMTFLFLPLLGATINPITRMDHALCHSVYKTSKRENIIFIEQETLYIWIILCIEFFPIRSDFRIIWLSIKCDNKIFSPFLVIWDAPYFNYYASSWGRNCPVIWIKTQELPWKWLIASRIRPFNNDLNIGNLKMKKI